MQVMRALGLLAVVAACNYNPSRGDDTTTPDAETCDVTWPFMPSNVSPCAGDPTDILRLMDDHTLDTGTGDLLRDGTSLVTTLRLEGSDPVVLALLGLEIGPLVTLTIVGAAPLVIAVHGSASIAGNIVVSATGTQPGAGAAACTTQPGENADGTKAKAAGGGGAGGAFGGAGGIGGNGDTDPAPQTPGGVGALETGEPMLVPLRGGCRGGAGGDDHPLADPVATLGQGGGGGGALQITARDGIELIGVASIQANGGGGARAVNTGGGNNRHAGAGGGGGGSGGAIFLESKLVLIAATATLCANGGSGGGGSHETDVTTDGVDGVCAEIAAGGGTGGNGGDGGNGGFATTPATVGLPGGGSDGGGGGGGGSVGRIRVRSIDQMPTGFVSTPPAQF